ncbi:MAG TPA: dienelactone hydrolase family protein [Gammaproteobacteria bacterium]|nr:dienelactone hydrolase family protein [Gammaproteobacteria bacterium]
MQARIEVYEGALHSWTTPDSPVHHPAQAERAWQSMLDLFAAALR